MVSAKIWGRFWCMQYRLWQPCRFETTQCNSLVNSSNWVLQVQVVDQTTHPPKCHSFVGLDRQIGSSPPANVKRFPANVKRFESKKFYICSDVTHTHTPRVAGFDFLEDHRCKCRQDYSNTKSFPVLMYRAAFSHSEGRFVSAWSVWIASRKLMSSSILHVSLISPDAIAALKVIESCWARSWIFGVKRVASVGAVVSMGTLWKGWCPCTRGISKWCRQ